MFAETSNNATCVVKLVARGNKQSFDRCRLEMFDVFLFSLAPWRSRRRIRVSAGLDDACNGITKSFANLRKPRHTTLVLDGIMQQSRNDLIFRTAMFGNERGDSHQMRNVWNV